MLAFLFLVAIRLCSELERKAPDEQLCLAGTVYFPDWDNGCGRAGRRMCIFAHIIHTDTALHLLL